MLIGIWGPSAVGKTTWLKSIMDDLPDYQTNLVVVFADNAEEYHYDAFTDEWIKFTGDEQAIKWKGTQAEKLAYKPGETLICTDKMYVIESMRWFSGLYQNLIDGFKVNGNDGLVMISPIAKADNLYGFLADRCAKHDKVISDYWTQKQLIYENKRHYFNAKPKWWLPNGIPNLAYEIDSERKNWEQVTKLVIDLLKCDTWKNFKFDDTIPYTQGQL